MIDVEISVWKLSGEHLKVPLWQVEVRSTQRPARQPVSPIADSDLAAIADLPAEARTWPGFLTALSPGDGRYSPGAAVLKQVGKLLYDRLLGAAEVVAHLEAVEARAQSERRPVRYLLDVQDDDIELAGLPLELLHDGHSFLFKRPRRPAFRLAGKRDAYNLRLGRGSRVLIATAHSEEPPEPTSDELQAHAEALVRAVEDAGFSAEHLPDATAAAVAERLRSGERVDLLYIACHGIEDRDQAGLLALRGDPLPGSELGRLLEEASELGRPVEAVILCACSSASPMAEHGTLGMAQWLADRNRAAASIGFRGPVLVRWALAFTQRLFEQLGEGAPLEEAFSHARHREPDAEPQWPLPVLYCPRPDPLAPVRRDALTRGEILGSGSIEGGHLSEVRALSVSHGAPLPSRLPRQPKPYFTGRQTDLEALRRWATTPGAAVITAVQGQGGIGKSELATVLAHEVRDAGRAVVWLDRPDFDLDGSVGALLLLARPGFQAPPQATCDDLAALMRRDLAPYAGLLVLDDVRDRQAVELLNPGEGWNVLVTTRTQRLLPGVEDLELGPLEPQDALRLLSRVAWNADEPPEEERGGAARLIERLGRLPLALELAGSTLRNLVSCEEYLASLDLGEGVAASDQERVTAVLGRSLRDLSPEDLEAFVALGVLPPVGAPAQVVATTLGQPLPAATRRFDRLVHHSVAAWSPETGRYRLHPELRREARRRVEAEPETWARLHAGAARAVDELAAWIHAPVGTQTQLAYERWDSHREFFDTLDLRPWRERKAPGGESIAEALWFADTFRRGLDLAPREDYLAAAESLTPAANRRLRANVLQARGDLKRFRSDLLGAAEDYDRALELFEAVEDRLGQANVLQARGDLETARGDLAAARRWYAQAPPIYREVADSLGLSNVLTELVKLDLAEGRLEDARSRLEEALPLAKKSENRYALGVLADALQQLAGSAPGPTGSEPARADR